MQLLHETLERLGVSFDHLQEIGLVPLVLEGLVLQLPSDCPQGLEVPRYARDDALRVAQADPQSSGLDFVGLLGQTLVSDDSSELVHTVGSV